MEQNIEVLRDLASRLQVMDYSVSVTTDGLQVFRLTRSVSVKEVKSVAKEIIPAYTKVLAFSVKPARYFYVEVVLK